MIKKWKKISSEERDRNPHWTYRVDRFRTVDGKEGEYYYHTNNNAITVFPQLEDGRFVMLREYRYLFDRVSLGHVQGRIEPQEMPEDAAHRELAEEVGYKAKELIYLGTTMTAPAFSTETVHIYLARGLSQTEKNTDEFETTEVVVMSKDEIEAAIQSREIWDKQVISDWHLVKQHLSL